MPTAKKSAAKISPVKEQMPIASTQSLSCDTRYHVHLFAAVCFIALLASFLLGSKVYAGLQIVPVPQPSHASLLAAITRLETKIDTLGKQLAQSCQTVAESCGKGASDDLSFPADTGDDVPTAGARAAQPQL